MKKPLLVFILCLFFATRGVGQVAVLQCHDIGWINDLDQAYTVLYRTNGEVQDYLACGNGTNIFLPQIVVAVIDPNTCEPWSTPGIDPVSNQSVNQGNNFGQLNTNGSCGRSMPNKLFFWNQTNNASMSSLSNFLDNVVPDSAYILAYTWIINPNNIYGYPVNGTFSPWTLDILASFQTLGFTGLDTITLSHPWIFFVKKGDLSSVQTVIGTHPSDIIDFSTLICTNEPFVSGSDVTVCQNDSVTITGNSGLLNYIWSTGDTTESITVSEEGYYVLTGQLDSVYNHSDSTYYPVYYTDSIFIDTVSCTGIKELENSFSIYPNPAKENITISFSSKPQKPLLVSIYTIYGTLTKEIIIPANSSKIEIPLSGFSPGVYHLSINTGDNTNFSRKVVVY